MKNSRLVSRGDRIAKFKGDTFQSDIINNSMYSVCALRNRNLDSTNINLWKIEKNLQTHL